MNNEGMSTLQKGLQKNVLEMLKQYQMELGIEEQEQVLICHQNVSGLKSYIKKTQGEEGRVELKEPEQIEKGEKQAVVVIPIEVLKEKYQCFDKAKKIFSYGEETFAYDEMNDFMKERQIQWINYVDFPNHLFTSRLITQVIMGKEQNVWEVFPVKGQKLSVCNKKGKKMPPRVEGIFMEEQEDGSFEDTGWNGIQTPEGKLVLTRRNGELFYRNGFYGSDRELANALSQREEILDCAYDEGDKVIYYVTESDFSYTQMEERFLQEIGKEYKGGNYIQVPFIPYGADGEPDFKQLRREKYIGNSMLKRMKQRLVKENIEGTLYHGFANAGECLNREQVKVERKADGLETESEEVEKKDAIAIGDPVTFEQCNCKTLGDALSRAAKSGKGIVYVDPEKEAYHSYEELEQEAKKIAGGLRKAGYQQGDKVVFQIEDRKSFLESFWGCILAGVIPSLLECPLEFCDEDANALKIKNVSNILEGPDFITTRDRIHKMNGLPPYLERETTIRTVEELKEMKESYAPDSDQVDIEQTALLLFTSGSTGMPKGVELTQRNLIFRSYGSITKNQLKDDEVVLNWLPLTHVGGIVFFHLRDLFNLAGQVQVEVNMVLENPLFWLDCLSKYKATMTWAPNFAFVLVDKCIDDSVDYGWDLTNLRYLVAGGEANVAVNLRDFIKHIRPYATEQTRIVPSFGMTETSSGIVYKQDFLLENTSDDDKFVSNGSPIPGTTIRIRDKDGKVCKVGEIGYVEAAGPTITKGYYHNEQANKETFTEDGYLITGDLGYIKNNELIITGREKDIIILNGVNYYCQDLETSVEEIEGIEPTCSIATSVNKTAQEELAIFYVPKDKTLITQVTKEALEIHQKIREIIVKRFHLTVSYIVPVGHEYMQKTDIGKRQRLKIKKLFEQGEFQKQEILYGGLKEAEFYALSCQPFRKNLPAFHKEAESILLVGTSIYQTQVEEALQAQGRIYRKSNTIEEAGEKTIVDLRLLEECRTFDKEHFKKCVETALAIGKEIVPLKEACTLIIPVEHALYITGDSKLNENLSFLGGFLKSLAKENRKVTCRLIDFDNLDANLILKECDAVEKQMEISYREQLRYGYRLQSIPNVPQASYKIPQHGTVMIAGGLGGVGQEVAKRMWKKYQANLILTGTKTEEEVKEKLAALEKSGIPVQYMQTELDDYDVLSKCIRQVMEKHQKVDLLIHAAGKFRMEKELSIKDAQRYSIENEKVSDFLEICKSKISGTVNLEKIQRNYPVDKIISISSVYGFFGSEGKSAYSAANSGQQALNQYYNGLNGGKNRLVSFMEWQDTGMSGNMEQDMKKMSDSILNQMGFTITPVEEALDYLEYMLYHQVEHAMAGIERKSGRMRHFIMDKYEKSIELYTTDVSDITKFTQLMKEEKNKNYRVDAILIPEGQEEVLKDEAITHTELKKLCAGSAGMKEEELNDTYRSMLNIWKKVLERESISIYDNFFEVGGNSLMISKLFYEIRKIWDVKINFQALLTYPTIDELLTYLNLD